MSYSQIAIMFVVFWAVGFLTTWLAGATQYHAAFASLGCAFAGSFISALIIGVDWD